LIELITIPIADVDLPLNKSICQKGNGDIMASPFHNYGSDIECNTSRKMAETNSPYIRKMPAGIPITIRPVLSKSKRI
jgi:hypothetical protein